MGYFDKPHVREAALIFIKKMRTDRSRVAKTLWDKRLYVNQDVMRIERGHYSWLYPKPTLQWVKDELANNRRIANRTSRGEEDGYHNMDSRIYEIQQANEFIPILIKMGKLLRAEKHLKVVRAKLEHELISRPHTWEALSRASVTLGRISEALDYLQGGI